MRRALLALLCCLLAPGAFAQAGAERYPERPIRFIVGFAAGGTSDILARRVAQELGPLLGQPVVVENRTGAGGNVALEAAARAEADGYTITFGSPAYAVNPSLYGERIRWRQEELAPIIMLGITPVAIFVRPESPARSLADLVALARTRERPLLAGISGSGTSSHLANILLQQAARLRFENVSYTGGSAPFLDLISGRLDLMTFPAPETVSYLEAGRVRVLALTDRTDLPALRGIPTVKEAGLPEAAMNTWYGLLAPRRTPAAAMQKLHAAAAAMLAAPESRARIEALGMTLTPGTPEAFGEFLARETARWQRVIAETGTRVE